MYISMQLFPLRNAGNFVHPLLERDVQIISLCLGTRQHLLYWHAKIEFCVSCRYNISAIICDYQPFVSWYTPCHLIGLLLQLLLQSSKITHPSRTYLTHKTFYYCRLRQFMCYIITSDILRTFQQGGSSEYENPEHISANSSCLVIVYHENQPPKGFLNDILH